MSVLNIYNCLTDGGNTGPSDCPVDPKTFVGAILLPQSVSFPNSADIATFVGLLRSATLAAASGRIYPLHELDQPNDASEANTYQTTAYGNRKKIRDGVYDMTYQIMSGGLCLWLQVNKFSNRDGLSAFFIDEDGLMIGMKVGDTIKGIPLMLFDAPAPKWNDGSNVTAYTAKFVYSQKFLKSFGFVKLQPGDWESLIGLQNVVIKSGTDTGVNDRTNAVSQLRIDFSCPGTVSFYDAYKSILGSGAGAAALWVATAPNGNNLTVTSVAFNDNIRGFIGTVDTADPDYSSGNKVTWKLADPTTLNTAGVLAVESNSYTTKN